VVPDNKMRFLLNPVRTTAKSITKGSTCRAGIQASTKENSGKFSSSNTSSNINKTWGQQCSPACGCVVRFEATVDPNSKTIIDSTYYAKSVISIKKEGKLEPLYTNRTRQPMFKECDCKTLHDLAQKVSAYLPAKKIDRIRNLTEFSKNRSSPAFRHAVLADHGHSRNDTHCFDVLEEAFTAMVRGDMPKRRENNASFRKQLITDIVGNPPSDSPQQGPKPVAMSSASALSALELIGVGREPGEDDKSQLWTSSEDPVAQGFDWITYVDEQHGGTDTA
jgi:hypothetical protein